MGEVYAATFAPAHGRADDRGRLRAPRLGRDPRQITRIWREVYARGYSQRPDLSLVGVLSGIELACWDIVGKELDRPVHALLGGKVRERLRSYTYLYPEDGDAADVYTDPALAAERAVAYVKQGFTARQVRPGRAVRVARSAAAVARRRSTAAERYVRARAGGGRLAVRPARRHTRPVHAVGRDPPRPSARGLRPALARGAHAPESPEAMAHVARATSIPVATGERLTTAFEFARVLETGAASILQPNLGRVGGLLEARKIAALAEVRYASVAPHVYCGPVVGAAAVQLGVAIPNFLLLEGIRTWGRVPCRHPPEGRSGGRTATCSVPRARASASSSTRRSPPGTRTTMTPCT